MNKTKNTTKRVRSATVFALVEGLIILLFIVLGAANLFFTNGTANRRTRQLVEDSYLLGYYLQRSELYTKKENTNEEEN